MASEYGVSAKGRGRGWRNDNNNNNNNNHHHHHHHHHHTMAMSYRNGKEESYSANMQEPFDFNQDWWDKQVKSGGSDEPINPYFMFGDDDGDDDVLGGDKGVSFQQTQESRKVLDIMLGTSRYLTEADNLSASVIARRHSQTAGAATTASDITSSKKSSKKPSTHSLIDSSVKKLEEVSKRNELQPPSYTLVSTNNTGKNVFAIGEFLDYIETESGNPLDEAREEAAIKMVRNLHIDDDCTSEYDYDFGHSFQYNVTKKEDQKDSHDKSQNKYKAPHLQEKNSNFLGLENFQGHQFQQQSDSGSRYPFPEFSLKPTGNKPYVWLLQSIASKMNFEVRYEIVPHHTSNSLVQCLVHLCKDPPVVCHGCAKSGNKAKSSAARCAFEYLKTIYQK